MARHAGQPTASSLGAGGEVDGGSPGGSPGGRAQPRGPVKVSRHDSTRSVEVYAIQVRTRDCCCCFCCCCCFLYREPCLWSMCCSESWNRSSRAGRRKWRVGLSRRSVCSRTLRSSRTSAYATRPVRICSILIADWTTRTVSVLERMQSTREDAMNRAALQVQIDVRQLLNEKERITKEVRPGHNHLIRCT